MKMVQMYFFNFPKLLDFRLYTFQILFSQLLTMFDPDDIKILTDVLVIKILQALKSPHDHDGIWSEWKTICTALICRMRARKERRDSYLRLTQGTHIM